MQAVGIQLSCGLSAVGTTRQQVQQALTTDTPCLTQNGQLLQRPIWVGAYNQPLRTDVAPRLQQFDSRNLRFALTALAQIEAELAVVTADIDKRRCAIVMGTSTSGVADNQLKLNQYYAQHQHFESLKLSHQAQMMSSLAVGLQHYLGWQGPAYTISTACSSSAKAIAAGQRLLLSNLADVVLVGGVDTLCPLTLNGFDSLESLSKGICQPCGQYRDGINIGEAAAMLVLTKAPAPVMVLGSGESMDAWHISAPHPEGRGALQAMQRALDMAQLSAYDIDYLNMHGTATPQNDAMEVHAIRQLFNHPVWVSSSKHKTGHCLGASGAIEAYIAQTILSSTESWLPYHQTAALDPRLQGLNYVCPSSQIGTIQTIMSNSFAFGGSNISLIFARGTP